MKGLLSQRVSRFIEEHSLIEGAATLVVGVSGGPDSVCLLHILHHIKDKLGITLHVAHLNHLLRGAESDADADYVSQLASHLGVPAIIDRRDVKAYGAKRRCSLEEAAREVRYAFLGEVAESLAADAVAVGHTANDQVETILMHLVRGAGLPGLRGMQPLTVWRTPSGSQLKVIRPLLDISREETEAYCIAHRLAPRWDYSNRSLSYLRNRIRLELIPLLQSYNPNIKAALLRLAQAATADQDLLEQEVCRAWGDVITEHPQSIVLNNEAFSSLSPSLKRRLLHSALRQLLGDFAEVQSTHIESLLKVVEEPAGKRLSLPHDLAFYGGYRECVITRGEITPPLPPLEGEYRLNIPGETILPGWRVGATISERCLEESEEHGFRASLDFDVTGRDLFIRGRRHGDRFQPLGMANPKKLQDFMVDVKIPRAWRGRVPIVSSPQHIIWVVGYRIDHRARLTPQTKRILCLEFLRA
jgi:tRNA(Ile)-lysidine synthase